MSRNKCFPQVRTSLVLRFICICDPFIDSPTYIIISKERTLQSLPKSLCRSGGRDTRTWHRLAPSTFWPAAQSISRLTNQETKPSQIREGAGSGPCCYAHISHTSVKCFSSVTEVPFGNDKLETFIAVLLCETDMDFWKESFKPSKWFHPIPLEWAFHVLIWLAICPVPTLSA
jgi:hypothetical protein